MLPDKVRSKIMMICGCLHDIAEKSKEFHTNRQIRQAQKELEKLIGYAEQEEVNQLTEKEWFLKNNNLKHPKFSRK